MGFNYIDIVIVALVAVLSYWGFKRGLIKTIFHFLSFVIAVILVFAFSTPFTNMMEGTPMSMSVKSYVYNMVMGNETGTTREDPPVMLTDEVQAEVQGEVESLNLPGFIQTQIVDMSKEYIETASIAAKQAVAQSAAQIAFNLLCGVLLFLIVLIVLNLIKLILTMIGKLPVIKTVNKLLGGVLGAVNGLLVVCILMGVLTFFASSGNVTQLVSDVNTSAIGSVIYNNNILLEMIFPQNETPTDINS